MFEKGKKIPPIKNQTYNEDIEFTFKLIKFLFKPIGIWTLVSVENTSLDFLLSTISHLVCFLLLPCLLVPAIFYIIYVEEDVNVSLKLLGPLGFTFGAFLKYICIMFHKNHIKHCFEHIENDWKNIESHSFREIMLSNVKKAHRITGYSMSFMCFAGLSYHTVLPLGTGKIVIEEKNITLRPLVYPGSEFYFNSQISPNYEIVFLTHCFYALITYYMTSAAAGTAALFVLHITGQTQIVFLKLNDFVDTYTGKKSICDIVHHHVKIMRLAQYSRRILQEICLIEFLASTFITCLVEYYCITEWENSNTVGIVVYICIFIFLNVNTFIYCYVGELLISESSKIGTAAFNTKWYKLPHHNILELKLIILRTTRVPKLTAGNVVDLSLSTFASVLKTSVAYLNLLRSVTA